MSGAFLSTESDSGRNSYDLDPIGPGLCNECGSEEADYLRTYAPRWFANASGETFCSAECLIAYGLTYYAGGSAALPDRGDS